MAIHDDLGDRMKSYEQVPKLSLMKRCPVIIRLDFRAGHTFTKGFDKPFDKVFMTCMQKTMQYMCMSTQNVVIGYSQSDEISLLLIDYEKLNTNGWFDYEVQKMCSIGAGAATMYFNQAFRKVFKNLTADDECAKEAYSSYEKALCKNAMFDCRCFNLPKDEVTNYFYWRQKDAMRNSIQMVGQANFPHKKLQNKNSKQINEMLIEIGVHYSDYPISCQRGVCCIKENYLKKTDNDEVVRSRWIVDNNIPIFKDTGRRYIDRFVYVGE